MIADQNPGSDQGIIWAKFLGRDTAFVNGPETLAMRYQLPVVYLNIQSVEKGNYELTCMPVYDGIENSGSGRHYTADLPTSWRPTSGTTGWSGFGPTNDGRETETMANGQQIHSFAPLTMNESRV
jgi:hypothetical protein